MSLSRQIRNIYTINFLIFLYIIWSALSGIGFENKADYKLYIITLVGIFIMQYICYKKVNKIISAFISSSIALLLMYAFINNFNYLLMDMIYYIFIVFLFGKYDRNSLDYYKLKDYARKSIYIIIAAALIICKFDIYGKQEILKFYIIYLASAIILLRQSRAYISNLDKKVSVKNDILISIVLIIFCFDWVSNRVFELISLIFLFIKLLLSYAIIPLEYIMIKSVYLICYWIGPSLKKIIAELLKAVTRNNDNSPIKSSNNSNLDYSKFGVNNCNIPSWMPLVLEFLMVLIIVYIIYKFMQRYSDSKVREISDGVFEEREKIKSYKPKKSTKKFFDFLRKGKSINDKVIYLFTKFEYIAFKNGILKKSMTANELVEAAEEHFNIDNEIKVLANIYNEAKFSGRDVDEDKYYSSYKVYSRIRKTLDKRNKDS